MSYVRFVALLGATFAFATGAMAAPPLEDYAKLPQVGDIDISPKGDHIAVLASVGDEGRLIVRDVATGQPLLAVNTGTVKVHDIRWMGNNHIAIRISQTITNNPFISNDKIEVYQTTVYNIVTKKSTIIFRTSARKIFPATYSYFGYSTSNGHEYGYFDGEPLKSTTGNSYSDQEKSTGVLPDSEDVRLDLYRVDLDTDEVETVTGGSPRNDFNWVVAPDGTVTAESTYRQDSGEWRLYAHTNSGALLDRVTSATHDVELDGLGRTPNTALVFRPSTEGDWSYREYNVDSPSAGVELFGDLGVARLIRDPVTQLLLGAEGNPSNPTVKLFDPALQAKYDKAKRPFTGERVNLVSWSSNMDNLIVETDGAQDSGTYFLVDIPGRKASAIGWAYPTIMQADVAPVSIVAYKAADGLEMEGVLTLPPGPARKNLALIVLPHGGPVARDALGFDWWAQALASRGYAVFQPNFRGSSGYGKAFEDAGHGQWGRKMQTDISDGVAVLAKQGVIDPSRVCIVGASYGGYAALAGVTVQHGLYRCAAAFAPITDVADMMVWHERENGSVNNEVTRYFNQFVGVSSRADPVLNTISPRRLAARADAPILLIHGKDDTTVPIEQSRGMADALRSAGKPVEMIELNDEDHHLTKAVTRSQMLAAVVAFVEKYNPPN
jgi:dipeptidyl aminopeptidase/acylaminoacyl peptidase